MHFSQLHPSSLLRCLRLHHGFIFRLQLTKTSVTWWPEAIAVDPNSLETSLDRKAWCLSELRPPQDARSAVQCRCSRPTQSLKIPGSQLGAQLVQLLCSAVLCLRFSCACYQWSLVGVLRCFEVIPNFLSDSEMQHLLDLAEVSTLLTSLRIYVGSSCFMQQSLHLYIWTKAYWVPSTVGSGVYKCAVSKAVELAGVADWRWKRLGGISRDFLLIYSGYKSIQEPYCFWDSCHRWLTARTNDESKDLQNKQSKTRTSYSCMLRPRIFFNQNKWWKELKWNHMEPANMKHWMICAYCKPVVWKCCQLQESGKQPMIAEPSRSP